MSQDTYYFTHDYGARNDPKLQRLFMRHGCAGIGIYWCIIEQLYEQGGKLPIEHIETIAFNLRTDKTTIEEVVFELNLFVSDDTHFWSERVLEKTTQRNNLKTTQKQRASKGGAPKGNKNACKSNTYEAEEAAEKQPETTENNPKQPEVDLSCFENNPIIKEKEIKGNKRIDNTTSDEVVSVGGKVAKRFSPPSPEEIQAYAAERGYADFDADRFVDYYTSNGWMVGKNRMKDWQAAVRSWARKSQPTTTPAPYVAPTTHQQPPADFHEQRRSEIARQVAQDLAATAAR